MHLGLLALNLLKSLEAFYQNDHFIVHKEEPKLFKVTGQLG